LRGTRRVLTRFVSAGLSDSSSTLVSDGRLTAAAEKAFCVLPAPLPLSQQLSFSDMKRAIAFISMLLMAHLFFVGNDWACAKHGSAMASPAHRAHSAASHQAQKTTSLGSPN